MTLYANRASVQAERRAALEKELESVPQPAIGNVETSIAKEALASLAQDEKKEN